MDPLVSIIVPCYKVEHYLDKCIDSLVLQTYTNIEIILVDDGSPDESGKICDNWSCKDSRIRVIHKKNGGLSEARNDGINIAKGEYLTFVDSDDYVTKDYVEVLLRTLLENDAQISIASYHCVREGITHEFVDKGSKVCLFDALKAVETMFYQETFVTSAWAKLFHRSLFETGLRFPKGWLYEDLALIYQLLLKANRIAYIDKAIYFYLLRADSIEGQPFNKNKSRSTVKIIESIQNNVKNYPSLKKAAQCRLLSLSFHVIKEMPMGEENEDRAILLNYIKHNRYSVLFNSRARRKARIASLLSLFSLPVVYRLGSMLYR